MKLFPYKDCKSWLVTRTRPYHKWVACNSWPLPLEVVEKYELCQIGKGRETKIRKGRNPAPDGRDGYILWTYRRKDSRWMEFATPEECKSKGVEPGPYNLFNVYEKGEQRRINRNARIDYILEQFRLIASKLGWESVHHDSPRTSNFKHEFGAFVSIMIHTKDTHEQRTHQGRPQLYVGTKTDWETVVTEFLLEQCNTPDL